QVLSRPSPQHFLHVCYRSGRLQLVEEGLFAPKPSSKVDEAWQMTYADLGGLGPLSAQVILVGDPGQIAPAVTGDSRRWQDWSAGPQRAAPEALVAAYPEAVTRLRLSTSWRLGPQTTSLIQP